MESKWDAVFESMDDKEAAEWSNGNPEKVKFMQEVKKNKINSNTQTRTASNNPLSNTNPKPILTEYEKQILKSGDQEARGTWNKFVKEDAAMAKQVKNYSPKKIVDVDNKINKFNDGDTPVEDWDGNKWTPISNVNGVITYEMNGTDPYGEPIKVTKTRSELMRGRYFGLGNRLDQEFKGTHPFDKVEIPKTTVIPENLNYESTFKAPNGKEVTGKDFIGKPEYTVNVLNNTYNTDVFVISKKYPHLVFVKNPKSETNDLYFAIRNQAEINKLLQAVSELFSQNTEYQE